jgi:pimeloyl-ACP methyl ester carboxylesterase
VLTAVLVVIAAGVLLLYLLQDRMIYHPRHYAAGALPRSYEALRYRTAEGEQTAYARLPAAPAHAIWVLFGGNGALALEWSDVVEAARRDGEIYLLIDYPGYGACEGAPSPRTIGESSEAALAALAARLGETVSALEPRLRVLGHSLGAAAALQFAARHAVERVVLLSPFTSLRDMARRAVGWPLCWLLRGNFDNRARVRELAARSQPPRLAIIHGDEDQVIPCAMGRELAALMPGAAFTEVRGAGHNDVVLDTTDLVAAMHR